MEVVNMTVCACTSAKINLEKLNGFKKLNHFDAVTAKCKDTTMMIFRSGKINCLGAKSFEQAKKGMKKLRKRLKKADPEIDVLDIRVANMVAHYWLVPAPLDLTVLFNHWKELFSVQLEPELYPALKLTLPSGIALIYHTGKVILNRAKSMSDLEASYKTVNDTVSCLLGPHEATMSGLSARKKAEKRKKDRSTGRHTIDVCASCYKEGRFNGNGPDCTCRDAAD
jgi:TATA-box binding protein (TBP) (component of TFIID and TFIIIB)